MKNKLNLEKLNNESLNQKLTNTLGTNILDQKASFKYTLINPKDKRNRMEINHLKSEHAMSIQKSKFIAVEHDLKKIQYYANLEAQEIQMKNEAIADVFSQKFQEEKLYLRFCNTEEVQKKRHKFFMYKGKYLG